MGLTGGLLLEERIALDATVIRVQALGRSRGGFGTKFHAAVDAFGLPVRFELGPGQVPASDLIDGLT
jgi:hypothetical protein